MSLIVERLDSGRIRCLPEDIYNNKELRDITTIGDTFCKDLDVESGKIYDSKKYYYQMAYGGI